MEWRKTIPDVKSFDVKSTSTDMTSKLSVGKPLHNDDSSIVLKKSSVK